MKQQEIINKVAQSGIITINLEDFSHSGERVVYDLKNNLFQELILKEKDFRAFIKSHDWSVYKGKNVAVFCSADAIVPTWAFMLIITKMVPYVNHVLVGTPEQLEQSLFQKELAKIDFSIYKDAKVVIKGCSSLFVSFFAYGEIVRLLLPHASRIMYGEPCSTVPIFKSKNSAT
jgi:hypothetical protein